MSETQSLLKLSSSKQVINLFSDLKECSNKDDRLCILRQIHSSGTPQDYTNAVILCEKIDKDGKVPKTKIRIKAPNIDYECDVCKKIMKNPKSKKHLSSKYHQNALNGISNIKESKPIKLKNLKELKEARKKSKKEKKPIKPIKPRKPIEPSPVDEQKN